MSLEAHSHDSVVMALSLLKQGERTHVDLLLRRYLRRLAGLAASRLRNRPDLQDYAEDVALSALKSLCLRVERGRISEPRDRDELWRLLATITVRKATSLVRSDRRSNPAPDLEWNQFADNQLDPAEAFAMQKRIESLFGMLDDDEMREIARLKVDGYSNQEIAARIGCVERTVERRLHRIRSLWSKELDPRAESN